MLNIIFICTHLLLDLCSGFVEKKYMFLSPHTARFSRGNEQFLYYYNLILIFIIVGQDVYFVYCIFTSRYTSLLSFWRLWSSRRTNKNHKTRLLMCSTLYPSTFNVITYLMCHCDSHPPHKEVAMKWCRNVQHPVVPEHTEAPLDVVWVEAGHLIWAWPHCVRTGAKPAGTLLLTGCAHRIYCDIGNAVR